MRRDDIQALREQKKHYLAEFRSLGSRYYDGKPWSPEDIARSERLQIRSINDKLQAQHDRELRGDSPASSATRSEFSTVSYERSVAREPRYEAFRSAGFARGKPAEITWNEFRALSWTGSVDAGVPPPS